MKKLFPALISLAKMVATASALTISTNYQSSDTVPLTSESYTATGNDISISLGFAPTTGADLMVVKNTGPGFINGTFSNLAQGQKVFLKYGRNLYQYVANYYGGDGNDLVLMAADVTLVEWPTSTTYIPDAVNQTGVLTGKTIISIASGDSHTLALCSDGTLAAWGSNDSGQLGSGNIISSSIPISVDRTGVLAGKTIISIAAAFQQSFAVCSDGTVAAWGYNPYGQLGIGNNISSIVPALVKRTGVLAGKTVIKLAAGNLHSLALCSDGTLAAWGYNFSGELGNGLTTHSNVPVQVNQTTELAGKKITSISAGIYHSMALCSDGTLTSWGFGNDGQLGNGANSDSHLPTLVKRSGVLAGKTVVEIAAGGYHSLARCSDGTLATWGQNINGQLGNDTTTSSNEPVLVNQMGVMAGKNPVALAAGAYHNVVKNSDNTLAAWGRNGSGQLGIKTGNWFVSAPILVSQPALFQERSITSLISSTNRGMLTLSSPDWGLSTLTLSSGSISSAFATSQKIYTVTVPDTEESITIKPSTRDSGATIKLNGNTLTNGSTSTAIPLIMGSNPITLEVITADGQNSVTYSVNVIRTVSLTQTSLENGTISDIGAHVPGETIQISAIPSPGYRFINWTGDASGQENPFTITMDTNKSVGAVFAKDFRDPDNDGISTYQEATVFHTDPTKADTNGGGVADTFVNAADIDSAISRTPKIGSYVFYDFNKFGWSSKIKFLSKLPKGLSYDESTSTLTGYLNGAPGTYALKIQVPDDSGVMRTLLLNYTIAPFPSGLVGSYQALVRGDPSDRTSMGILEFTITDKAVLTASLTLSKSKGVRKLKGEINLYDNEPKINISMLFPSPNTDIETWLYVDISENSVIFYGDSSYGKITGFRLAKKGELKMKDTALGFLFDQGYENGITAPAGLGWATGKLSSSTNSISLSGKLGDAQPFKTTLKLSATGQAILWTQPYGDASGSYFGGIVSLRDIVSGETQEMQENEISWYSGYRPAAKSYPDGFGPMYVKSYTSSYSAPLTASALAVSLGLSEQKMGCRIEGGDLDSSLTTFSLPDTLRIANNFTLTATTNSDQPLVPWSGKVNKKDGTFLGSIWILSPSLDTDIRIGNAAFSGLFMQNDAYDGEAGGGLIQIPIAGRKGSFRTASIRLGGW